MNWFLFFLLSLGVARVTWFITEDHMPLIAKPREWMVSRKPDGMLAYLVECWWCVSIYTGAAASAFAVWMLDLKIRSWDIGAQVCETVCVHTLSDWKLFLTLWPAFSMAAVAIMSVVSLIQDKSD